VWKLHEKVTHEDVPPNKSLETHVHKTIKKVGDDIESMRFNTAISAMMILLNEFEKTEKPTT
jgi:leucyl-tRNA synthetase